MSETVVKPGQVAEAVHTTLRSAGVNFAAYLPDSVLCGVADLLEADPGVQTVICSREDEGVAIAIGAYLGGKLPVVLMEGSGAGYCGLILARALLQRTPMLLLVSHNPVLGERFDYHGATRIAGEGVMHGLGIPHMVVYESRLIPIAVRGALDTVRGQKVPVCLFIPGYVMHGDGS
jgi:sulfopyruvate decarboxylase TPP-binding subunit